MRTQNSSIPNYPTRTVHVQFQTISCILYSSRFSKCHSRMTLNHQSIKPSVECHKELTKLNTTERTHTHTHTHQQRSAKHVFHNSIVTNQMNTPRLRFFLDYFCLCSAPFQPLSGRRSSRGTQFFG